jgi:glutamate 5-kinase
LLTDQDGLYDGDPRTAVEARLIATVTEINENIWGLAGGPASGLGTGGMFTKIQAAQLATRSGTRTVIARSTLPDVLLRIAQGEAIGTTFEPMTTHLESRKRWILAERPQGTLQVDDGAAQVINGRSASLLPIGVRVVKGQFERGAIVLVADLQRRELAKGLVNYSSMEITKICGHHSREIGDILGYTYGDEVVHRDYMVILAGVKESEP